jgi:hypothetical protein
MLLLSACLSSDINRTSISTTNSDTSNTATTSTLTTSARAVRIIFKNSSDGSFNSYTGTTGTEPKPGSGHPAVRLFNPDNSLLANGSTSTSWPGWLTGVEIGISGANLGDGTGNLSAANADCARFASSDNAFCNFDNDAGTADIKCSAPDGLYRISEFDCTNSTSTITGNGGPNDGVYIRATINRDTTKMAATENIMAVLEYASSDFNRASQNPSACFTDGLFTPTAANCSDMVWQLFVKHNAYEIVQPFLLLVPPSVGSVDATNNKAAGGVATKQFIIPLAGDSGLKVFQFSRIKALDHTKSPFSDSRCGSKSAHCVGMVFYSLTLYRM